MDRDLTLNREHETAASGAAPAAGGVVLPPFPLLVYNLFPLFAGRVDRWAEHLPRIAAMGFTAVSLDPFHPTGGSDDLYAVADHLAVDPRLSAGSVKRDRAALRDFTAAARRQGLAVMMDLGLDRVAPRGTIAERHPDWLVPPAAASGHAALGHAGSARPAIAAYFVEILLHYLELGFRGFRCVAAHRIPGETWRALIAAGRAEAPDAIFCADTLGAAPHETARLAGVGFDYLFDSLAWWDYRSAWLFEERERLRRIAPSIGFLENRDTERLATRLAAAGIVDPALVEAHYRQRYAFAAAFSVGLMMAMGFEWGWRRAPPRDGDDLVVPAEEKRFDLADVIAEIHRTKRAVPALAADGAERLVSPPDDPVLALARCDGAAQHDVQHWAFTLLNRDGAATRRIEVDALLAAVESRDLALDRIVGGEAAPVAALRIEIEPLDVVVLRGRPAGPPPMPATPLPVSAPHPLWRAEARIVIEDVAPTVDGGRYPVKRVLGDAVEISADILRDGHDKLAAVVKYRPAAAGEWHSAPLHHVDNDRWGGSFVPDEIGRWRYTIEAWTDHFESWRAEVGKKRAAGQDVALELVEGRALVAAALTRADEGDAAALAAVLAASDAASVEERAALLLSRLVANLLARWPDRADAVVGPVELELVVDRPAARFAAWYEMFPRSQGRLPGRGASFEDCIRRLPEIAGLGFDVVYLVPIHPIGRVNRKGRDNAVDAAPDDPGSPYAIGAAEGGHRAVHPELGTLEDFRRFVAAAAAHGMEVALDFAVQCAPDHPWIAEHPQWFVFRPDGTIKYAENPPKKYQDIVNVDFYNPERDALWRELRDVILFWAAEGVRIFRVDNPHTKPVPFWEWCIREVQVRYPDAIFLSEAFTRPKIMKLLAKAGFTQSYSYFTWRNTKSELTQYLTELTQGPERDYMRPNFFTNTPDILPPILQQGGRPAFLSRLVLAATLSPSYGIYNGFELCEATAIPETEEYLHSEKYEYKVWDWDRPGNIKGEIAALNRFRRMNPALRLFTNLVFCATDGEQILAYVKATPDRGNIVLVVVNLDPFAPHEAVVDLPLHAMGLSPNDAFRLDEAFSGAQHRRRGAHHRFRLDPAVQPADLYRVTRELG